MTPLLPCISYALCCICSCLLLVRYVNDATSAVLIICIVLYMFMFDVC